MTRTLRHLMAFRTLRKALAFALSSRGSYALSLHLSIGHQSLHPTRPPLPSPFCHIGYRSFDTSNMTADAVFAEMQKHFDA